MLLAILSSCLYGWFAVFRMDKDYNSHLDYLNSLSLNFKEYYFFTEEDISFYNNLELWVECIFFVVMLMNSMTEYKNPQKNIYVRDIKQVIKRYIKEDILGELIPLLPLGYLHFNGSHYLYFIKVYRLRFAFEILDVKKLFVQIKAVN